MFIVLGLHPLGGAETERAPHTPRLALLMLPSSPTE